MLDARRGAAKALVGGCALLALLASLVGLPSSALPSRLAGRARSSPLAGRVSRDGSYTVATANIAFVEPAGQPGASSRPLPTLVLYPAARAGEHLAPDRANAPYPLLVFSSGYDIPARAYENLLFDWASAGFVVAAPTYPHNDPSDPGEIDESDIVNNPADLRFVIAALLKSARRRTSVLSGMVGPNEVGVVGHSDGADVSLAVADNSCCRDRLVKAVAVLSGAELSSFGGSYFAGPSVPLLVVQGSADTVNFPTCSTQIYDGARRPRYYLDLLGAGHEPPYTGPPSIPPLRRAVARVTTDFFDAELAGERRATAAMTTDGNVGGTARLTSNVPVPPAPGNCPGA